MVKKRGLGKSLDALLAYTATSRDTEEGGDKLIQLPLEQLQRGKYQPRREMDQATLEELAHSIRQQGIIQPLIVRPVAHNQYEIIAGERRMHAARMAELSHVPVIVRPIPDEAAIAIALIENIQREDLNPIEEALALQRLIDEFQMTHQEVAEAVGKSRASVSNLLRLLALPQQIKQGLLDGILEMGHARALITLPELMQIEAANLIASKKLSVRETENWVRRYQTTDSVLPKNAKSQDPDIVRLQESLSKQFKLRVLMQCNAKGKGKLIIHYRNLRELDNLLLQIQEVEVV